MKLSLLDLMILTVLAFALLIVLAPAGLILWSLAVVAISLAMATFISALDRALSVEPAPNGLVWGY